MFRVKLKPTKEEAEYQYALQRSARSSRGTRSRPGDAHKQQQQVRHIGAHAHSGRTTVLACPTWDSGSSE
ncbi:hypothetical protein TRAPUB_7968 [Trametes pubescens]|uniref:Uncharacterized protein n=1 Tax=Trametes pubescens TaxID=154538 RepID=A0A1M2V1W4_TRAPU|nr:hypothetical protein TRAPUB_7968 [Trametes pubescens]